MLHVAFVMDCHDREIISFIASDNGPQYTAHATINFLESLGFEFCRTPAYSPESKDYNTFAPHKGLNMKSPKEFMDSMLDQAV